DPRGRGRIPSVVGAAPSGHPHRRPSHRSSVAGGRSPPPWRVRARTRRRPAQGPDPWAGPCRWHAGRWRRRPARSTLPSLEPSTATRGGTSPGGPLLAPGEGQGGRFRTPSCPGQDTPRSAQIVQAQSV
ncbi:MAG: hypothetical protein AVDCRST_MAG49-2681, partial [uncultured Thermomicrobiales bacterium]